MKSLYAPEYRRGSYLPVVHAYYDRADMLSTTIPDDGHAHTLCEIMYVNEGAIEVEVCEQVVDVGRRQFIFLDATVYHRLRLDDAAACSVMNIEFQMEELSPRCPSLAMLAQMDASLRGLLDSGRPWLALTDMEGTVYSLMKQIILLADSTQPESEALCSWLTGQTLLEIARCEEQSGPQSASPVRNHYVSAAVAFIDAHYLENLTANEIAWSLHVQATYLHRLFKEHMRMTIGEYINSLRLSHARGLLERTNQTLLEIAIASSFSSQQRFTELFRQAEGVTPAEYRHQYKGK